VGRVCGDWGNENERGVGNVEVLDFRFYFILFYFILMLVLVGRRKGGNGIDVRFYG
jgi:hypothetical protein